MGRSNVEYNGKWACFSSVTDSFITEFMDKELYESWRIEEYGRARILSPLDQYPLDLDEAVSNIRLNRSIEQTLAILMEAGISESDSIGLVKALNARNYTPKPSETGGYICPNCSNEVFSQQRECINDSCMIEFIWS